MKAVESSERKSDTATAGSSPPKPPLNRCDSMTTKMNDIINIFQLLYLVQMQDEELDIQVHRASVYMSLPGGDSPRCDRWILDCPIES